MGKTVTVELQTANGEHLKLVELPARAGAATSLLAGDRLFNLYLVPHRSPNVYRETTSVTKIDHVD